MVGQGIVVAVSSSAGHTFSKAAGAAITLLKGLGVEGDAHCGVTVKHRSRVARDPSQPNLRQIHLMHAELCDELSGKGYRIQPGQLGENITTRGMHAARQVQKRLDVGRPRSWRRRPTDS
jgi:hypothetical protein